MQIGLSPLTTGTPVINVSEWRVARFVPPLGRVADPPATHSRTPRPLARADLPIALTPQGTTPPS